MEYTRRFDALKFDRPADKVLRVTINRPDKLNALTDEMHDQLVAVWKAIDGDPEIACTIITGAGRAFCAGGDISRADAIADERDMLDKFSQAFSNGAGLVYALINSRKPIVSAINGPAAGAGAAIALLADVPIAAKSADIIDAHTALGVAAGDHSALIWPLLCGMAKSKYYLLACEKISGEQAERSNLVALCVEDDQLQEKSIEVAARLASLAPTAVRMTKYTLNHWLRQAAPIFELSLAMEVAGFYGSEVAIAAKARREKKKAIFKPSNF